MSLSNLSPQELTTVLYTFGGLLALIGGGLLIAVFQFLVRDKHKTERQAFFSWFKKRKPVNQVMLDQRRFELGLPQETRESAWTGYQGQWPVGTYDDKTQTIIIPRQKVNNGYADDTNLLPKYHDPSETQIIIPDWASTNGPR